MENLKPRIEFYRQRSFSEKMNVIFAFIRENWKPLLKYSFYLIMPVCLIQTFAMNSFFNVYINAITHSAGGSPFSNSMGGFLTNYGALIFCMLIGSGIMSGLVYAMMQTYSARENGLQQATLNDFREMLVINTWKYIRLVLALFIIFVLIIVAMASLATLVSTQSLIITIPILLVCILALIPLMLVFPAYIFERDITFTGAFRKAWKLGFATLGGMIGLMIVLSFIAYVIQSITQMPWYLTLIIGNIFSLTTESTMNQSVIYKFMLYVLGLIQSFGMYVSSIISIIGLAFQYFHAREKVEGVSIESNISNFSSL